MKIENYWPLGLSLLGSGWFIVMYLVMKPGLDKLMLETPPGTVLNIVPPTMYLYLFVVVNAIALLGSIIYDLQDVPP